MTSEQKVELHRGLRDVHIDRTRSSFIDGDIGKLLYRGYNIDDLATKSTFEETIYLLLYGELPTQAQLDAFDAELRASRALPEEVLSVISLTQKSHPMDVLRTAVSALAAYDPETEDNSAEATLRKGIRLTAQASTIVAAHARIREGKQPVAPDASLNHAANFLYMLFGEKPDEQDASLIDKDFILHAEHGINASSFGARVTASTQADLHCAVTTGIGVLKGPSHGGAAEEVMKMAMEIGDESNAENYVRDLRAKGGRVMGFGHRVYKAIDPRSIHLKDDARALGERKGQPGWVRHPRGGNQSDGALRAARHLPERGLLLRRHLLPAGHPRRPVHFHIRYGAHPRLDCAGAGAVRQQHPAQAPPALHRRYGLGVCAYRPALTPSAPTPRH